MTNKYEDSEPHLADHGGDLSKRWYIDYKIFDTDKQAYVRKRYTGMNKHKTLTSRRNASFKALDEINELLKEGYTAGKKTESEDIESRFDLSKFTLKQAVIYFLNYKNASLSGNEWERLETQYNKGVARISENTLAYYLPFHNTLFAWLEKRKLSKILLKECTIRIVNDFFTYLKEVSKVESKTYNNYRGTFSTLFNFYRFF